MNYDYLKVFYEVCKYQNFSKAAKALYTSQPAISRTISIMESELNTKLFVRTKFGVALTREGKNFYEMIKNPFDQLEKVEQTIQNNPNLEESTIYLGATVTALNCFLFEFLETFHKNNPKIHYHINTGSSNSITNQLIEGKLDIAFITTPYIEQENITGYQIKKINNILIGGKKITSKIKGNVSIKDLNNYPFVLLSSDMQFREHINQFLKEQKTTINPVIEADTSAVLIPMVEHDYGLAFVPEEMAKEGLNSGKIKQINLQEQIPVRYVTMLLNEKRNNAQFVYQMKDSILKNTEL